MQQNNTQTMLLQNQPFLAQLYQNNQQPLIIPNQQPLIPLQQINRQPLLIPNQQPLLQIQQNNGQAGVIAGQLPLVNVQQNVPQKVIIPNQTPLVQPQLNNIQAANIHNQGPIVEPKLNNIQPAITTNQMAAIQPQLNNNQPTNLPSQPSFENLNQNAQTNIETNANNETNNNLKDTEYLQSLLNELKESEFAEIEYSRGLNQRKVFKSVYNCHAAETFEIYLGKGENVKNSLRCTEVSESFQRYCVSTSKRQFDMDMFYNISEDEIEFTQEPIIKIHRVEGGCCSDRGILTINYPNDNKRIGVILEAFLANIYDANNQLLYRVKLPFEPKRKNCFQRCWESCCGNKNEEVEVEENEDCDKFLIKKIVEKEEQVEDIMVQKKVQVIVGKMENYPLKIIFPVDASPKEKILLIICRIFLLYIMNFSVTLRERWYETCKDFAKDWAETEDRGILGKINEIKGYQERYDKMQGIMDTIDIAGINKNIISLNNFLDD